NIQKFQIINTAPKATRKKISDKQAQYSTFLNDIAQIDSSWWNTCHVNRYGLLGSNNPDVNDLLDNINDFVQSQIE
ncbi:MAG: hypothetical protein AAF974_07365, partial [Cyanobacteria bacterium P01_E01_bin.34]